MRSLFLILTQSNSKTTRSNFELDTSIYSNSLHWIIYSKKRGIFISKTEDGISTGHSLSSTNNLKNVFQVYLKKFKKSEFK